MYMYVDRASIRLYQRTVWTAYAQLVNVQYLNFAVCISLSFFPSSVNVAHSIDFEIDSQIDLGINPKLCKFLILLGKRRNPHVLVNTHKGIKQTALTLRFLHVCYWIQKGFTFTRGQIMKLTFHNTRRETTWTWLRWTHLHFYQFLS